MLKFRGGSSSKQKSIPDSFKSRDTFELIMGLGEGPWWGPRDGARSLYIDQTPIVGASGMSNFTNISLTFYPGSALGELIKPRLGGFSSPIEVSVGMTKDLPITRDGVQTNIDWVELRLVVQALATETDDGVRAAQAQVKVEWKKLSSLTWTNAILYQEPAPQTDLGPAGAQASYVVYDPNDVTEAIGTPVVAQSTMPGEPGNKFLVWLDDANGHQPYVWDTETDTWVSDANAVGDNWEFTNSSTGTTNTVYVNPVAIPPYVPYDVTVTYPPGTFIGRALRSFNGAAQVAANPGLSYANGVLYINDKITSAVVRELRFAVENTGEVLEYRFTKLSNDTADKLTSELAIESIQEVKADEYTFPNTAMLQVVGQGNDQISGNPTFQGIYKMRIVKVPSNFDPITSLYDGIWDGTYQMAWTRSVPWIFMDFVENSTFGLSKIFPHVCDKWKIYAWAQHADALVDNGRGGTRPRWTFNHVQKDKIDAKEFAQVIASAGGARYTDDGNGLVTVFFESIDEPVVAQFTNENVTGGAFRYSSTDRLTRSNQVTGRFKNPDLFFRDDTRTVVNQDDIDDYGTIPEEFEAIGCRDVSELQARARYRLVTSLTEKRYVNFQTHRKGRYLAPWQLIAVCDQDASYGLSGTITAKTGARAISIREPVALEPGYTYLLKLDTVNPDYPATSDQQYKLWEYEIVNEAGTHSSLTVDADLPDLPEFCTFSLGNADTIGVPKVFRVHKISEVDGDPDQVQITALICNRTKWTYIDGGTTTLPADDSRPYYNGRVEPVTNPQIDFTTVTTGVISTLNAKLSWDKSATAYVSKYKVYDSVNDGPSIDIGDTNTNQYSFENFTLGQHALTIVPVDFMGRSGPATVLRVDSTGELRPVQKITNLRLSGGGSTFTGTSAVMRWDDAAPDTSFSHYLVEVLETATDGVLRTETVTAREWTYDFDKIRSDGFIREVTIVVHVVDLVGNVSDGVEKSISNPAPAAPTLTLVEMPGGVEVRLSTPTDPDFIGYKVWASATTGFTPNDATNLIFKGSTPPVLSGVSGDTIYVRAAAYDQFGETGLNIAAQQSATYGSLDAVAITGTIETSQIADDAVTAIKIGPAAVVAGKIDAAAVLTANIADLAVGAAKVAAGAIETAKIATGAVTSNELGAAAVIAGKIGALAVGTADIAALAITAAKIGGSAVGNTKIAAGAVIAGKYGALSLASGDIAASAIIAGKYSAGSIVSADVSAGGIQTANIAALAVTAAEVAAAAIVTSKLATGAVTSNELGAAAVITSKLAALAVTSAELATGSVITAKIGALAVTAAEVAAGAIVTAKLATGAVTSNELGAAAVVNAKLATDAVQSANIQAAAVIAGKFGALAIASGDIAAGAVVTAKIGSAAVTATELGAAAVTNAKIATDAVQAAQIQAGAVVTAKIGALAVTAAEVAAGAIITAKLATGAVTSNELGASSVISTKIGALAVGSGALAAGAVIAGKYGALSLASADVAAGAIITSKLATGAVTATELGAAAVTNAKIATDAVQSAQIQAAAVVAGKIGALAIASGDIAAGAIIAGKFGALSIAAADVAAGAIITAKLATGAVTATELGAAAVTNAKIATDAVQAAQIQAAAVVAGKIGALAIASGDIAAGAIITAKIGALAVTTATIAASAITATELGAAAVTTAKINAAAVTTTELGALAVTGAKIAASTITAAKIAAGTITATEIAAGTITASLIAAGAITAASIAAGSITATEIAAGTITAANLSAGAITASKIYVTDNSNMCGDVNFQDTVMWTLTGGWAFDTSTDITTSLNAPKGVKVTATGANPQANSNAIFGNTVRYIVVEPSKAYRVAVRTLTKTGFKGQLVLTINWYDQGGTFISGANAGSGTDFRTTPAASDVVSSIDGQVTSLATAGFMGFYVTAMWPAAAASAGVACAAVPRVHRATSAELIVDGSIVAAKIAADTITASQIAANAITATELAAGAVIAGKITAGTIVAADIAATTITAAKIVAGTITATEIAADTITAAKIAANAITSSELAAGAVIAGKITAGTIVAADIAATTITAAKIVAGTITATEIAADTITASQIAANAITATELAAGAVIAGKITAGTIVAADIAATTITAAKIVAGTITTTEIAAGTITASDIAAGTITANEIAATTITAAKIVAGTITTTQIAAGTITASNIAAGTITATLIAAGTITASKLLMTDFTNLTADPYGLNSSEWSYSGTIPLWSQTTTHATAPAEVRLSATSSALVSLQRFPANNGDTFRVKVDTKASADATADLILTVWSYDKLDGFLASHQATLNNIGTSWVSQSAVIAVANASCAYVRIGVFCGSVASGYVSLTDMYFTRANAAELIVDGSIVAGQIAADTITAAQIAAGAISATELAANAVIAGKISAGTIVAADIAATTITAAKIVAGTITTAEIAAGTIVAADIAAGTITATQIAADTITASQIAANAITATELAANSVIAGKILAGTIVAADIAATTITAAKIVAGTITTAEIAAGTIVAADIAAGTITATQIAATTITAAKIVAGTITTTQIAAGTIVAANIAAGTITASRLVLTDTSNMVNDAEFNEAIGVNNSWALGGGAGTVTLVTSDALVTALQGSKVAKITGAALTEPTIRYNYIESNYARTPVEPGKPYFCAVDYAVTAGFNGSIYADLRFLNSAGTDAGYDTIGTSANYLSSAAGSTITGTFSEIIVAPATAVVVIYRLIVDWNTDYATRNKGGTAGFTRPRMRRAANGELIVDGAIVAAKIAADTITATQIAAGAIAASELAANAVIAGKIAAGTIVAADIAATTITAAKIVAGTITTTEIAANTIVAADIAAGTITATQIASSTITATQIAAGTITATQIAAATITGSLIAADAIQARHLLVGNFDNIVPDGDFRDATWWGLSAGGSVVDLDSGWTQKRALQFTDGTYDCYSEYFPMDPGATYRIRARIWNNGGSWTGYFHPLIHVPNTAWYSLKHGAGVVPSTHDASNGIVAAGDTGTLEWIFTNPTGVSLNANRQVQFRMYGSFTGGPVLVTTEIVRVSDATLIKDGAITTAKIVAGAITAGTIAADTITATQIAAGAIAASELAANAVIAGKIAAGTIVAADIAATTITAAKIAAGTLTATEIAATTITAAKIAAGTITATQIAAGTITATQIAAGTITATQIAAGTIDATKITVSSLSALSANLGAITAGTLSLTSGSYVVYEGAGFGASSDLVLWFGLASTAMGAATKTNGLFSLANDGIIRQGSVNVTQANAVLSATFSPAYVSTTHSTSTPLSQAVTVTPTGGSGSYNYVWSVSTIYSGAVPTLSAPYAATCTIGVTHNAIGTIDGIIQCLITDTGTGKTVTKYWAYYSEGTGGGGGAGGGGGLPP
jgi:predicted phage tail protein